MSVAVVLLVAGGTAATAGTAEATPKPRACNTDGAAAQLHTTGSAVYLRADKRTSSPSRALLARNTDFYAYCWGIAGDHDWWAYGRVVSGPYDGREGWVRGDYVATGYRHG
ncbi:SH3 domain-containing protein [Streptomyces sp. NPDC091280]|uniref:SH3 domain-containing protein n=1 Tax=Streptomyces sp. NPDC091280 TaxID=3365984 RepID=UPI00381AB609